MGKTARSGKPKRAPAKPKAKKLPDTKWHKRFFEAYKLTGQVLPSLKLVGVSRGTFDNHRRDFPEFDLAYQEAKEADTQEIEISARNRAVNGVIRKRFTRDGKPLIDPQTGKQYEEREYSDILTIFLLKSRRPDVYRDRFTGFVPGGAEEPDPVKQYDSDLVKHWKSNAPAAKK